MTEPGDEMAAGAAGGYRPPVSSIDREQVIRTLRVALAQGRLTEDEHDARAAQASAAQSQDDLAALTADLPAGLLAHPPTASHVWTGVCLIIAAAIVVAAVLLWQPDNGLAFMAFVLAALTLLVAPVITVGLMLDVRHQKRPAGSFRRGQPPRRRGSSTPASFCTHHHGCRRTERWRLEQLEPGVLKWHTPSGLGPAISSWQVTPEGWE